MSKNTNPNARFWIRWKNSYVKVTMKPGDELHCGTSEHNGEGFSAYYISLDYDGVEVSRQDHSRGRDCDGYTEDTNECVCPLAELGAGLSCIDDEFNPIAGMRQPKWQKYSSDRHDEYASDMNY